jgi:MoxR-like ATPase
MSDNIQQQAAEFRRIFERLLAETQKVIVGNTEIIEGCSRRSSPAATCCSRACPASARRCSSARSSQVLDLPFNRIQFTPDLMPADIVGTNVVQEDVETGVARFSSRRGPIFTNIALADEINRATPEDAVRHARVHAGKAGHRRRHSSYKLDLPFFVLATQNPLEMEGTYPLPEAQLDRFLFKLLVPFPKRQELGTILDRTTTTRHALAEQRS